MSPNAALIPKNNNSQVCFFLFFLHFSAYTSDLEVYFKHFTHVQVSLVFV